MTNGGHMKKTIAALAAVAALAVVTGCNDSPADVASHNVSNDADHFKIERHIVFFNGITDKYLLEIYGRCSLGNNDQPGTLSVTCETGPGVYKKHFLGLSDNVSYFVEQTVPAPENTWHYKVNFRPETLIPDFQH